MLLGAARPALAAPAHDPGEGTPVTTARLTVASDGRGVVRLTVLPRSGCARIHPRDVVARRAGRTIRAPLSAARGCELTGDIQLPGPGRWFVYADLTDAGHPAETWLAAYPDRAATVTAERLVYRPAQATPGSARRTETAAGAAIYTAGLALLGSALAVARRRAAPASEPARQVAGPG